MSEIQNYIRTITNEWTLKILRNSTNSDEILKFILKFDKYRLNHILSLLKKYWIGAKVTYLSFKIPYSQYIISNPRYCDPNYRTTWFLKNYHLSVNSLEKKMVSFRWSNDDVPLYTWGPYGCSGPYSMIIIKVPWYPLLDIKSRYHHKITPACL